MEYNTVCGIFQKLSNTGDFKMANKWTKTEEEFLVKNFNKLETSELAKRLNRTDRAILYRANKLGLSKNRIWTEDETKWLTENYSSLPIQDICIKLSRTEDSIYKMASRLDLTKEKKYHKLTKEYLEEYYIKNAISVDDIAKNNNIDVYSVYYAIHKYNIPIHSPSVTWKKKKKHHHWKGCGDLSGAQWSQILGCAKSRGISVNINIQDAWKQFELQNGKCALSGVELLFSEKAGGYWRETTASLDRIDSKMGYTKNNIQWIHKRLQAIKLDLPEQEFFKWCKLIIEYRKL